MEGTNGSSRSSEKKQPPGSSPPVDEVKMGPEKKDFSATVFVNHGNILSLNASIQNLCLLMV